MGAGKTLTGEGDLTLVATAGGITEKAGDDGKVQINMSVDDKTLTITQLDPINTLETGFVVTNDEDTALDITSTGGLIKSTMAGDWKSIVANASGDLTLTNLTNNNAITIGNLTSGGEIWVQSIASLTTPATATITANGVYDATVDNDASERARFKLASDGDPIDVAIYLASYDGTNSGGDVTVNSTIAMADNGTMVIDAYNKIEPDDHAFGAYFTASAPWSDATNRLEIVSRISQSLDDAINNNRLPHASEARGGAAPSWFTGEKYVLRGKDMLLAEVLAMVGPVPLVAPVGFELEDRGEIEGVDMAALLAWLEEELGQGNVQSYLENAYLHCTDLRPYKAAARLRNLAGILKDEGGLRLVALIEIVAKFVEEGSQPTEAQVTQIITELKKHKQAGEWLEALATYVSTLRTEIGWTADKSVALVMGKYGSELTQDGDVRGAMFIQMYLQSITSRTGSELTQAKDVRNEMIAQMYPQPIWN